MKMAFSPGMVEADPAPGPSLALRGPRLRGGRLLGRAGCCFHNNHPCRFATGAPSDEMALHSLPRVDGSGRGWVPASAGTTGDRVLPIFLSDDDGMDSQ